MYFLRRLRPLEVAGERVRSLRLSLNAPVLSTPDLPAGPARALIVVHRDARGRMDATVGVRSVRRGEVAYWSFDAELTSEADISVAADAALTFAESLGFLFDEAPLAGGSAAEKAFRSWLAGEEPGLASPRASNAGGRGDVRAAPSPHGPPELALDELVLEELSTRDADPARRPTPELPPLPAAGAPRAPQRMLSKFRAREAAPEAENAPVRPDARKLARRLPLARVQLVKRRSPEDERRLVLRRLLTSF